MEVIHQRRNLIHSITNVAAIIGLAAMTILVFVSIILRYFFSISFRWSDELTRYIFTYVIFLGIPIAYLYDDHVVIEILTNLLPSRTRKWLAITRHIIIGILMLAIGVYGMEIVLGKLGRTLTPGLKIPRAYICVAIPIGAFFLVVEITMKLKQLLRKV